MTYLEILEQVCIQSGHTDILKAASNIHLNSHLNNAYVTVYVRDSQIPENFKFATGKSTGYLSLSVLKLNPFNINKPYLVEMPDRKTEWVSHESYGDITTLVPIPEPTVKEPEPVLVTRNDDVGF